MIVQTSTVASFPPPRLGMEQLSMSADALPGGGHSTRITRSSYGGRPYLLKHYRESALADMSIASLEQMIAHARSMDISRSDELFQRCAWPVSSVWDRQALVGVLMRPAPAEFYEVLRRGERTIRQPRHLDVLGVRRAN